MSTRQAGEPLVALDVRVVSGSGGGPDKTILNSPRFLIRSGYRMLCAYLHRPGDPGFDVLRAKAVSWHAPLLSVADHGPFDWRVLSQLLRICRQERVQIWHGHDYKSNAIGLLLRRFWSMQLVTTVHGWVHHTTRTPLYYKIDRWCLPGYDRVICVSEDLHAQCLACGVPEERCLLLENGIDTAEFLKRMPTAEAKERLGVPAGRLLVGAVGRLSAEKGFDILIRAACRLLQRGFNLEVHIAGEGDERPRLEALIKELGCVQRIRLVGYTPDTRPLYEAMDVFALSSLREGLPNVLLEAMAMGVPVVATRIAGVPRLIHDGQNGLLVESGSLDSLELALAHLLRNPSLRANLCLSARRTIETRYDFATRMRRMAAIYDELLGSSSQHALALTPDTVVRVQPATLPHAIHSLEVAERLS